MGGGGRADPGGVQGIPLAAGAQHEEDGVQAVAVGPAGPAAAELMGVGALGDPGLQLLPQPVGPVDQ